MQGRSTVRVGLPFFILALVITAAAISRTPQIEKGNNGKYQSQYDKYPFVTVPPLSSNNQA